MRSLWFSAAGQNLEPDACCPFPLLPHRSGVYFLLPGASHLPRLALPRTRRTGQGHAPLTPHPAFPGLAGREVLPSGEGLSSVGREVGLLPRVLVSCASLAPVCLTASPSPRSHAASPGQLGIPPERHGGRRTGPDLPPRHYGKPHSKIAGQGIVLQEAGTRVPGLGGGGYGGGWDVRHTGPWEWGTWHKRPLEGGVQDHPCPDDI